MFQIFEEILKHFNGVIHTEEYVGHECSSQDNFYKMNKSCPDQEIDILSTNQSPWLLPPFHLLLTKSIVTSLTGANIYVNRTLKMPYKIEGRLVFLGYTLVNESYNGSQEII